MIGAAHVFPLACGSQAEKRLGAAARGWRDSFNVQPARSPLAWIHDCLGRATRDTVLLIDMASVTEQRMAALHPALSDAASAPLVVAVGDAVEDALRAFEIGAVDFVEPEAPRRRIFAASERVLRRLEERRAQRLARGSVRIDACRILLGEISVDLSAVGLLQQVGPELRIKITTGEIRVSGELGDGCGLEGAGFIWLDDKTAVAASSVKEIRTGGSRSNVTAVFVDAAQEWLPVAPTRGAQVKHFLRSRLPT